MVVKCLDYVAKIQKSSLELAKSGLEHDPDSIQQDNSRRMLNKENTETANLNVSCYFQIILG